MDVVVYLALAVLAAVFVVSFIVLILMCQRRRINLRNFSVASPYLRFSKLRNEHLGSLMNLSPKMAQVLDKNTWVYDVSGLLQHCVALLRLCHLLSEKLSGVSLQSAQAEINEMVCQATQRIMPRFDDLLTSVANPKVDVRVLEARATALATVCWALFQPFALHNPKYRELHAELLQEMDLHLEALRQAADMAEKADVSLVPIDWNNIEPPEHPEGEEDEVDETKDDDVPGDVLHLTETMPLVESSPMSTPPLRVQPQIVLVQTTAEPLTSVNKESITIPLLNGNGSIHPTDPAV